MNGSGISGALAGEAGVAGGGVWNESRVGVFSDGRGLMAAVAWESEEGAGDGGSCEAAKTVLYDGRGVSSFFAAFLRGNEGHTGQCNPTTTQQHAQNTRRMTERRTALAPDRAMPSSPPESDGPWMQLRGQAFGGSCHRCPVAVGSRRSCCSDQPSCGKHRTHRLNATKQDEYIRTASLPLPGDWTAAWPLACAAWQGSRAGGQRAGGYGEGQPQSTMAGSREAHSGAQTRSPRA